MGLFLMESLRITRLFPVISALSDKMRVRMIFITFTILLLMASVEAGLAYMREVLLQDWHILEVKLLLEVLSAGGNHDALARENGRNQIGERFAGACAGLDDQVLAVRQRGFHGFRHG